MRVLQPGRQKSRPAAEVVAPRDNSVAQVGQDAILRRVANPPRPVYEAASDITGVWIQRAQPAQKSTNRRSTRVERFIHIFAAPITHYSFHLGQRPRNAAERQQPEETVPRFSSKWAAKIVA
jgi:hypothetical protein